jgi:hypothetical protein
MHLPGGKEMSTLLAFEDPSHEGNSAKYHTDKPCIVKGCKKPAGTLWGPHWCFTHNVERMNRITASLTDAVERARVAGMIDKSVKDLREWAHKSRRIALAMVAASGGELTINVADIDRECTHESVNTPGDGTQTWRVTLK